MKTKKLSIAIALLAVAVIGTSCGNKQQKSSSDTTTEQTTSSALEIDSLLANAENLAGKEVTIEGVCTHTCKHGAKKIFLMGSDDTQVIRVEAGTLGAFDPKCVNSIVRVTGTLKEQRIDEAYLQNWEAQLKAQAAEKHGTGEDSVFGETYKIFLGCEAEGAAVETDQHCRLDQYCRNCSFVFCMVQCKPDEPSEKKPETSWTEGERGSLCNGGVADTMSVRSIATGDLSS